MSDDTPNQPQLDELPEAAVERRRGISIVWLIPLVAALIGAWLAYKTITEAGPTITITFKDGAGLEAGKTKIKYKAVEVGKIETVELKEDLTGVHVTAKMSKSAAKHLTQNTQFWVVRPQIGLGGISGLETLVSGAYIAVDPRPGPPSLEFRGLDKEPGVTAGEKGRKYTLRAHTLGALGVDSPVYFRDIQVGRVLSYELAEDDLSVLIHIFINAPHDRRVVSTSRFWIKTGFEVSVGAEGLDLKMGSLAQLLAGGVAFETPVTAGGVKEQSKEGTIFELFESFKSLGESRYTRKIPYLVYFDGSVRGLSVGAPVEFQGIKVGSVTDIAVEIDEETLEIRVPVVFEMEPDRVTPMVRPNTEKYNVLKELVERGLKAQLQMGSLLTGQLFIELNFYPDLPKEKLILTGKYPEIPTIPATMDEVRRTVTDVLAQIRRLPLDKIAYELLETLEGANRFTNSPELIESVQTLNETIKDVQQVVRESGPSLGQTLDEVQKLARDLDQVVLSLADSTDETLSAARNAMEIADPNSSMVVNLASMLEELAAAARSIRGLADYLERHPEALVHGKGGERD